MREWTLRFKGVAELLIQKPGKGKQKRANERIRDDGIGGNCAPKKKELCGEEGERRRGDAGELATLFVGFLLITCVHLLLPHLA